jgi:hypothetical protein
MAEELELDPRVQRVIWRGLGTKSPKQIAADTGLTPEDVIRIKNQMLEEVDVLTVHQRRQKILVNLEQLANEAWDRASTADPEFQAGLFNTAVAAQKELVRQLVALQAEASGEVERLNEMRVRELLRLIDEAVLLSVKELSIVHGLDEDEMMSVFNTNLKKAAERRELE